MSRRMRNILLSAISLVCGGLLYVLFRETTYISTMFEWFSFVSQAREFISVLSCDFVAFYLPDFLWGFALCSGLLAIFNPDIRGGLACALTALLWGVVWEIAQYAGVVSGTGDVVDILMYLMAIGIATIIHIKG